MFRWGQREGQDQLEPTDELIVSPSQVVIAPGQRQLIRILREGEAPAAELGYRILVDELAGLGPADGQASGQDLPQPQPQPNGLQFRLRYSIPVFVAPHAATGATEPRLTASLRRDRATDQATLEIDNQGNGRARLAEALLVSTGKRQAELSPGLLGYVLSGQSMRWPVALPAPTASGSASASTPLELKVRVNGEATPRLIPIRVLESR